MFRKTLEESIVGNDVGMLLGGMRKGDVQRGMIINC